MNVRLWAASAALLSVLIGPPALAVSTATAPLVPQTPLVVPGGPGAFDWMTVDAPMHRVFASHKGTKTTVAADLKAGALLPLIPTGTAQGLAVDQADNKIFAGDDEEHTVVVLDRRTLQKTGEIPVTGPVDAVAFDPKNGMLYADHDDGTEVWVISAKTEKIAGTVTLPGAPEYLQYDPKTDRVYQNIKTANAVVVINPNTNAVEATWPTAPMTSPHGLAIDDKTGRLFTAGDGLLDVMDLKTGRVLATVTIAPGYVDQIAFDPAKQRVYCACSKAGQFSVVQETADGATLLANVPAPPGAHTLAVDPKTHAVWTCYAGTVASYLLAMTAP